MVFKGDLSYSKALWKGKNEEHGNIQKIIGSVFRADYTFVNLCGSVFLGVQVGIPFIL